MVPPSPSPTLPPPTLVNGANGAVRRACMVVHSHYPLDPRVRRETEALLEAGWEVDVICVPDEGETPEEVVQGVRVVRLPVIRNRNGSRLDYIREYGRFVALASARLARLHPQRRYDVVQVHNMPDFLVYAAWLPKLRGARIVLDMHDLVPEFFALRYGLPLDHRLVRLMRWVQRTSTGFADHVLTAGEPFRRQVIRGGVGAAKVTSIMNSPDPRLFGRPRAPARPARRDHFVLCYHGTLGEQIDLSVVLRAMVLLQREIPGLELRVYGRGRARPGLQALAHELGLGDRVTFYGVRPLDEMPAVVASADLGVVPQCASFFTALNFPTKAFEYIVSGVPVLLTPSPALVELFGELPGTFFTTDDVEGLARLIRAVYADPQAAQATLAFQQTVCARFAWASEKQRYLAVMNGLANRGRPPERGRGA